MNIYVQMDEEEFDKYRSKQKPKELYDYSVPDLAFALMEAIKRNGGAVRDADAVNSSLIPSKIQVGKLTINNVSFSVSIEQAQERRSQYESIL